MKTVNSFSPHRLGLLLRKDFYEHRRAYLLLLIVTYGVMALFFLFLLFALPKVYDAEYDYFVRQAFGNSSLTFHLALLFAGAFASLSGSMVMPDLSNKASRLQLLSLPALPSEKFVCRWLVTTIGGALMFLLAFEAADFTRVIVGRLFTDFPLQPVVTHMFSRMPGHADLWIEDLLEPLQMGLFGIVAVQSFFLLGGMIWHRLVFVKTFTTGVVIVILFSTTLAGTFLLCHSHDASYYPRLLWLDEHLRDWHIYVALTAFALVNWIIAYFRFRETELRHRLL